MKEPPYYGLDRSLFLSEWYGDLPVAPVPYDWVVKVERVIDHRALGETALVIQRAIEARRRWFDRCAFCDPPANSERRHVIDCPWLWSMAFGVPMLTNSL